MKEKETEITGDKLKLVKTVQEAWGDRCTYTVKAEDMPENGRVFVMARKNYSSQPETVKRNPDGTGSIELFYSIGD